MQRAGGGGDGGWGPQVPVLPHPWLPASSEGGEGLEQPAQHFISL